MPAPDSALEEWRGAILRLLQRYEQGGVTLRGLGDELAVLAPGYLRDAGNIDDVFATLLRAGGALVDGGDLDAWELALRDFRRELW